MGKHLIPAAEAARRLGVDKGTVARWCQSGKLPALRTIGGHWRIRASLIDHMVREAGKPGEGEKP